MIEVQCKNCKNMFKKYPSSKKMFCSRECANKYKEKQVKHIRFICLQCGKEFSRTEREVKNSRAKGMTIKFCSKECKSNYWGRNRVEVICPVCGKKFLQQARLANVNLCCSPECSAKNPKNMMIKKKDVINLTCQYCGKSFCRDTSYVKKQRKRGQEVRYCCKECANEGKAIHKKEVRRCLFCEKEFVSRNDQKFCSNECRKEWLKINHSGEITCQYCNKTFRATKYQITHGRKFCSLECRNSARHLDKRTYKTVSHYLRSSIEYANWRSNVLERAHFTCEKCGAINVKLHAHHKKLLYDICRQYHFNIDDILHSKEFNDVDNGSCLCLPCHIKEHPYDNRLRNIKGQFCRREFKTAKQLTITSAELSGKTGEKPQSEPKALLN